MDKLTIVAEWRKYADADLDTAEHMAHDMWPTHDLNLFCGLRKGIDAAFVEVERQCADLTQFGVQPRYPFEISIDKAAMLRALNQAEAVQAFMRRATPEMFAEGSGVSGRNE
jgi:hypothetical protein